MRIALVNPRWAYQGSIYFGCREPHLPLELGYTAAKLEAAGHETLLLDGQLDDVDNATLAEQVADFEADMTVVTTAPTYLFWRCAPPELTSPANFLQLLSERGGKNGRGRSSRFGHAAPDTAQTRMRSGGSRRVRRCRRRSRRTGWAA
jgi:anaerobic magnesium-protoporphyrin IX monomethyl ester cyclase